MIRSRIKRNKFRKASLTDVLFLMFTLLLFIVVMRMQLEFSTIETIETYAKNTINSEFNTFTSKITGFSTHSDKTKMFNNLGEQRAYSRRGITRFDHNTPSETSGMTSIYDNNATSIGVVQYAIGELKQNILREFNDSGNSWNTKIVSGTTTSDKLVAEDISVMFSEDSRSKSTLVTLIVSYKVDITKYTTTDGPLDRDDGVLIPRNVKVVRTIENPSRFQ